MSRALRFPALALLAALPFVSLLQAGFVWDDFDLIVLNPVVLEASPINVLRIFTEMHLGLYAPLVYLSFMLEHLFFKLNPAVYHFDNIVLHALNVFAVYYFSRALGTGRPAAWCVAALFAVHPAHVESVAWISQRKDLLYALFYWLAASFYVRKRQGAALLFFTGSLLSKPMAVTLPFVLLAYEIIYCVPREGQMKRLLPFFIGASALASVTFFAFRAESTIRPDFLSLETLRLAAYSVLFYLGKTVFPFDLSALYAFPETASAWYRFAPVGVLILAGIFIVFARKNREVMFGGTFFIISLLPVLQLVPVGNTFAADRYLYAAVFGILFALTRIPKPFAGILVAALLCLWGGLSYERAKIWKDDGVLWSDVLRTNPKSPIAHYNRGLAHQNGGRLPEALADYEEALRLNPGHPGALQNRGIVYGMMGDAANAVESLDVFVKIYPKNAEAYYNRGVAYVLAGDFEQAKRDFLKTLEINPHHEGAKARLELDLFKK